MTIHRIHRNQQGITLIEVLAAVLLLGAAAVLSVQLFQTINLANRKNDLQAAALRLAQSEINRLLILAEDRPPAADSLRVYQQHVQHEGKVFDLEIQDYPLTASAPPRQSPLSYHTTLQAIILCRVSESSSIYDPRFLQVTVSWEEAP